MPIDCISAVYWRLFWGGEPLRQLLQLSAPVRPGGPCTWWSALRRGLVLWRQSERRSSSAWRPCESAVFHSCPSSARASLDRSVGCSTSEHCQGPHDWWAGCSAWRPQHWPRSSARISPYSLRALSGGCSCLRCVKDQATGGRAAGWTGPTSTTGSWRA